MKTIPLCLGRRLAIAGCCLALSVQLLSALDAVPIPATHHVLVVLSGREHEFGPLQLDAWFKAMDAAGLTPDQATTDDLALSARDLLGRYDAILVTTSAPALPAALEEFVRQGGGLILVQDTSDQSAWFFSPVNAMLPTSFCNLGGYGWNTRFSRHDVRAVPDAAHETTAGIDWKAAPPLAWMYSTPPPNDELYRGDLSLLAPRERFLKPLLNCNWNVVLRADDSERLPLAVTGSFGRGRIFLWDAALGGSPDNFAMAAPFAQWDGFAPFWGKVLKWTAAAGKVAVPQPAVWIVGDAVDNVTGVGDIKRKFSFPRTISYALPDVGLGVAAGAEDAGAALVLKADPAQDPALARLAQAGKPLMICDPSALNGTLKPQSPLSDSNADAPGLPPLVLGTPVTAQPPAPIRAAPSWNSALKPLSDAPLQPPQSWSVKATGSEIYERDFEQKWFAPDYDAGGWSRQPLRAMTQDIGGEATGFDGAIWYRASIQLPADAPADALWIFRGPPNAQLRAWSDGREIPVAWIAPPAPAAWAIRLKDLKPGVQILALRLYEPAFADSQVSCRNLYANTGLTSATAESGAVAPAQPPTLNMTTPKGLIRQTTPSTLPAKTPLLFSSRADGDKDFHLEFDLSAEQAARSPLLIFDEPGLIRQVRVNGHAVERVGQGAWDGVSGGNTSAFLLSGVLKAGKNTLDFHPDFTRFRDLDYPVATEVPTPCALPTLEWTGGLQVLQAIDPALAPQVPNRLFNPGSVVAPSPDAKVLLRWNDGRPALVRRGSVLAWTSNITAQMNADIIYPWSFTWEGMEDFARATHHKSGMNYNGRDGIPRADSLLWENAAPLVCTVLADAVRPTRPQVLSISPAAGPPALEVDVSNPGPAGPVLFSYRLLNRLGSMVATEAKQIDLASEGVTKIVVPIPHSGYAGEAMKPEWELIAAVRSMDNGDGLGYLEKVVEMPPPLRVSIATDSIMDRLNAGAIPQALEGDAGYRGRHLWWPFLFEDAGSSVYLDGETAHVRVTLHNETDTAQSVPLRVQVLAQIRGTAEKQLQQKVDLPPHGWKTLPLDVKLSGDFEPYLVKVDTGNLAPGKERALYAVRPWKQNFSIDHPPHTGLDFVTSVPFYDLQEPDNIDPEPFQEIIHRAMLPSVLEWLNASQMGTSGGGGGANGLSGDTQGLGWGPFDRSSLNNVPNQMSFFPNGQPMMHYIADGMNRRRYSDPYYHTLADYWVNFSLAFNWQTLAAFREWLAANHPERLVEFTPRTMSEAQLMVRFHFAAEWNAWQNAVVAGSWGAVRDAASPGSLFWDQADQDFRLATGWPSAASGTTDGLPLAKFFGDFIVCADPEAATQRVGWGFRYRSYLEGTSAALALYMHFNVTSLRHGDLLNEQRMGDWGNATIETYRSFAYDTVWNTSVKPDGTLRSVIDTPPSEGAPYPNLPFWSGLNYGNLIYDRLYRWLGVVEPQRALGNLWVATLVDRTSQKVDARALYETLRNNGVALSAMISPENLSVAPKTGAAGLVYLLPNSLKPEEIAALDALVHRNFPVVCLVSPDAGDAAAHLPQGVVTIVLPDTFSPEGARTMAETIGKATGRSLTGSDGTCVYGFGAVRRVFVVAQNMWSTGRDVDIELDAQAAGLPEGKLRAANLNDNGELPVTSDGNRVKVKVHLGPWDAALVLVGPAATSGAPQK